MMCSMLESAAYNIRDTDDLLNPVGAGCLTGVIYKITSVRQPRAPQRLGIRFQPPSAYRIQEVGACPVCSSVRLTARVPCFSGPESGDVRGARLGSCGCCRGFCVQADLISWSAEKLYVMHEVLGRRVGVSSATERRVVRRVKHASRLPGVRAWWSLITRPINVFARGVHEVCMRALHTHTHTVIRVSDISYYTTRGERQRGRRQAAQHRAPGRGSHKDTAQTTETH